MPACVEPRERMERGSGSPIERDCYNLVLSLTPYSERELLLKDLEHWDAPDPKELISNNKRVEILEKTRLFSSKRRMRVVMR